MADESSKQPGKPNRGNKGPDESQEAQGSGEVPEAGHALPGESQSGELSGASGTTGREPFGPGGAEGLLRRLLAANSKREPTPLGLAQELVEIAWQSQDVEERMTLARQAITVSADCADAYLLLAHYAADTAESLQLLETAVAAGERAIGPVRFARSAGNFWLDTKTRPYMRARLRLAQCLWEAGQRRAAIEHFRDLVRLNPRDNQGVRYLLLSALLDTDRDDEALILLGTFEGEVSADWVFTAALLSYRREGDTSASRKLLEIAVRVNRHVPGYLVGVLQLPSEPPQFVAVGEESEAAGYVGQFLRNWRGTEGAIPWVRKTLKIALPRPPKPRKPAWNKFRDLFLALPQNEDEVWQLEICRLPIAAESKQKSRLPWAVILWNCATESILTFDVGYAQPTAAEVWDLLVEVLLRPRWSDAHRPQTIELRRKAFWKSWNTRLKSIGVECRLVDELEGFAQVIESFAPAAANARRLLADDGETEIDFDELGALPQEYGEVWQVDARRLPGWLEQDGELSRPWATLVAACDERLVLFQGLAAEVPDAATIAQGVLEAICKPLAGEPHRPAVIEFARDDVQELLAERLESLEIACVSKPRLAQIDELFSEVARFLSGGKTPQALIEVPGVHLESVGSFYDAAAHFYRYAPWRRLPGDKVIKVVCNKYSSSTWYSIVMGQSGMLLGLAMYQDLDMLRELFSTPNSDDVARRSCGLSVMFGEAFEIPTADLDASERYEWPVAGIEAYPNPIYVNPGRSMRPPLGWELELIETVLRGIPLFVDGGQKPAMFRVPTAAGRREIEISCVAPN